MTITYYMLYLAEQAATECMAHTFQALARAGPAFLRGRNGSASLNTHSVSGATGHIYFFSNLLMDRARLLRMSMGAGCKDEPL